jgi:hypothetical protein
VTASVNGVQRRTVAWLAAGIWLVYLTTSSGGFESGDAVTRYETARSWLAGREGALPAPGANGAVTLPDGRVYSFFGPLQSVLMVPVLVAVRALPGGGVPESVRETFAISLAVFPLVSTAAIVLLFLALRLLGYSARVAFLAASAVALGSLFWHYARTGQEEHLVALGYALWLYGAARLAAGRSWPALFMAAGGAVAVATRWAVLPQLAVLAGVSLLLLLRHRNSLRWPDLAGAALLLGGTAGALLLYNAARFGAWWETGYGVWFAQSGLPMFLFDGYGERLAALLFSPYRGLLWYSPAVLLALPATFSSSAGDERVLRLGGFLVLAVALLFFAAFHFWSGGHAWGPRFLAAPQVLLAPALAGFFARSPRRAVLVPLLALAQLFSTVLPASTEEYVRFNVEVAEQSPCSPWRFECAAVPQRLPRALRAVANTWADRPGMTLEGRPMVPPEVVLETSDYRTIYWWPVRIAFRLHRLPPRSALLLCLLGLALGTAALFRGWRLARDPAGGE